MFAWGESARLRRIFNLRREIINGALPRTLQTLRLLVKDPFAPQLETHKLKGKLSGSWACSVDYDLRIIFDFVKSEKQKEYDIFLIEIGTHEEVY